jgi:hypothetical protein
MILPQAKPDQRKRQADGGREENEIFRHLSAEPFCFGLSRRCLSSAQGAISSSVCAAFRSLAQAHKRKQHSIEL